MTGGKGPQPNVPPGELKRISEAGGKQMRGKEEDDKGYVTGYIVYIVCLDASFREKWLIFQFLFVLQLMAYCLMPLYPITMISR